MDASVPHENGSMPRTRQSIQRDPGASGAVRVLRFPLAATAAHGVHVVLGQVSSTNRMENQFSSLTFGNSIQIMRTPQIQRALLKFQLPLAGLLHPGTTQMLIPLQVTARKYGFIGHDYTAFIQLHDVEIVENR